MRNVIVVFYPTVEQLVSKSVNVVKLTLLFVDGAKVQSTRDGDLRNYRAIDLLDYQLYCNFKELHCI